VLGTKRKLELKQKQVKRDAVPIYRWSTHPLNNTGVLLTGSCLVIGKGTWSARSWEPMGGDTRKNNRWKHG
jgi:hypothetical protein